MAQSNYLELRASIKGRPGANVKWGHWLLWIRCLPELTAAELAPSLAHALNSRASTMERVAGLLMPATADGQLPGTSHGPLGPDEILLGVRRGEAMEDTREGAASKAWVLHYDAGPGGGCTAMTAAKRVKAWAKHELGQDGSGPAQFADLRVRLLPARILEMNREWRPDYAAPAVFTGAIGLTFNSPGDRATEIIRAGQKRGGGAA